MMINKENSYMREDETENFSSFLQKLIPMASSLLLLLVFYLPFNLPLLDNIRPAVGMVCVYFWMIHRPDIFNLFSVYLLGLMDDVVSNVPFGSNIFSLLLLYLLLTNLQRFVSGKSFAVMWYGFMLLSLVVFLAKWFVLSVYYSQFLPFVTVCFSYLVTIAFYPFLSLFLAWLQNSFMADED